MKRLLSVAILNLLLLLSTVSVSANQIVNGDFSSGLTEWSTEDLNDSTGNLVITIPSLLVSNDNGHAKLETGGIESGPYLISLYQWLEIPDWANTLSFDIAIEQTGTDSGGADGYFPDVLEVSYLDDDDISLDKYFVGLDIAGPYDPVTFEPLNNYPDSLGWYSFEFDISDLVTRTGTLYFDLSDQDDGYYSFAKVDNVQINAAPVPEPTTLVLSGLGLLLGGASILRIRRKQTRGGPMP